MADLPSSPINLTTEKDTSFFDSLSGFSGIIRIAVLPNSNPSSESILDLFSRAYPVSGDADFVKPFTLEYKWEKRGYGDLLMLAHPLHLKLLTNKNRSVSVLGYLRYNSIDGDLVGVIAGDSWVLKPDPVPVTWHSIKGGLDANQEEIIKALVKDVKSLDSSSSSSPSSSYFFGKSIARAARLVLIAEEVCYPDVIPKIRNYLKEKIEQVKEDDTLYPKNFTAENRLVGVLWSMKRDSSLWFGQKEWIEHRLGIQLLPILPVSKILFSDVKFVRQLMNWILLALQRDGVEDGWKGFVYVLEGVYDKNRAIEKIRRLKGFDNGNSMSNLLRWIYSRE